MKKSCLNLKNPNRTRINGLKNRMRSWLTTISSSLHCLRKRGSCFWVLLLVQTKLTNNAIKEQKCSNSKKWMWQFLKLSQTSCSKQIWKCMQHFRQRRLKQIWSVRVWRECACKCWNLNHYNCVRWKSLLSLSGVWWKNLKSLNSRSQTVFCLGERRRWMILGMLRCRWGLSLRVTRSFKW